MMVSASAETGTATSVVSALALPAIAVAFGYSWPVIAFTACTGAAVIFLHRANLRRLRIRGRRSAQLFCSLDRNPHDPAGSIEKLAEGQLPAMAVAPYDVDLAIAQDGRQIVDNTTYSYVVHAYAPPPGSNLEAEVHGVIISYDS